MQLHDPHINLAAWRGSLSWLQLHLQRQRLVFAEVVSNIPQSGSTIDLDNLHNTVSTGETQNARVTDLTIYDEDEEDDGRIHTAVKKDPVETTFDLSELTRDNPNGSRRMSAARISTLKTGITCECCTTCY